MKRTLATLALVYLFFICFSQAPNELRYSLFLIGNSGRHNPEDIKQCELFKTIQNYNKNNKGIIFTGNNFLPSLKEVLSGEFEGDKSTNVFEQWKGFNGKICFIPGWTDWAMGSPSGKDMLKWEHKSILKQLDGHEVFMPDWACPGPLEVPVNDSLTIILLDTQWWLQPFDKRLGKCDIEDESDVWISLQDALRRNRNKQVVVAGYNPVVSYGEFGGYFSPAQQIFGFPVVLFRKHIGTRNDLSYPTYKELSNKLEYILNKFPNVIYVSSHEQNFQYINKQQVHYVIGGSLTGGKHIKSRKVNEGSTEGGYSRIDFYSNGEVKLLFFPIGNPQTAECESLMYVYQPEPSTDNKALSPEVKNDSILIAASLNYVATPRRMKWMGTNYRNVWAQPVKVPVFDIQKEHGGLEITARGGGQQTHAIRLKDNSGHQYSMRSVEKYVEGALPSAFKNTFAVRVAQDNITASNPYSALAVAPLADAAGVMHTNPKITYIPNDPRLGVFKEDLAGYLFLYEERATGNWSSSRSFGFSEEIIGTPDVLERTQESPKHLVDQKAVLKARIFDTFVNDWDRHDDQWRWASFKKDGQTLYRPIPRDRDQAFYVNEGILPKFVSHKWLLPKLQGFAPITKNMDGLAYNARYFDRTFLTEPNWGQWKATVDSMMILLDDQHIEDAMKAFPKEVQPLCANKTADILKLRRENLEKMAREHYLSLAKNVDVTGTDDNDLFEIKRLNNDQTEISVLAREKKRRDSKTYYHRIFNTGETKEIRLYGLSGDDSFNLSGNIKEGIVIRIIGGKGKDTINNTSVVADAGKHLQVYDEKKNTTIIINKDTRNHLSTHKDINSYDRLGFHYNVVKPGVFLGYNPDDGIFFGGGPVFNTYKYRRNITHAIMANYAALTSAFNVKYNYSSESAVHGLDYHLEFDVKAPDYAMNYFGMGNNSAWNHSSDLSYYRLRINQLTGSFAVGSRWGKTAFMKTEDGSVNQHEMQMGMFLKRSNVEEQTDRFISDLANNGLNKDDMSAKLYACISAQYSYRNLDRETNPRRGILLTVEGRQFLQVDGGQNHFFQTNADFSTYLSFNRDPRTVFAFRFGGSAIWGNYPFYEAAKLGGKTNLRGFGADRFYGDQSFYQNSEIRYKLFDFSSYILNGEIGLVGFHDLGRVWLDGENSAKWHKGLGSGFWVSPFKMAILTATYNHSKEDNIIQLLLNFKF